MGEERLQKYISSCGITSRRKAEEMILKGEVKVNGIVVNTLGAKVDDIKDIVTIDNKQIKKEINYLYIKLFKPEGCVTTVKDQFGRKTVLDFIDLKERIYPIGRLDYDTSGLLLLTNDGELANKLMHPRYHMYKTYVAEIEGVINESSIDRLKKGVTIEDYKTAPAKVRLLRLTKDKSVVEVSIYEGKNRQVRKMFKAVGHRVEKLTRISYGKIDLGILKPGQWNHLNNDEIKYLKNQEV